MSSTGRGQYSVLQKAKVTCNTCHVSESFYSDLSVEGFKQRHSGHDIVGGARQRISSAPHEVESAPKEERPPEKETATKLAKVVVDLVVEPAADNTVLRVRGYDAEMKEVFVSTSSIEQAANVREMLEGEEHVDNPSGGLRYIWQPEAIEYEGVTREILTAPAQTLDGAEAAEPQPEMLEGHQGSDRFPVVKTDEVIPAEPESVEAVRVDDEPLSASPPAPPAPLDLVEDAAPRAPPRSSQESPPEAELVEVSAPAQPPAPKAEQKDALETTLEEPTTSLEDEREDGYLLVSQSWYIQGGTGNRREAVRISKVLKAFRWKVEPVYTIGVILDDILSIETSKNQISRTLIKRIEETGYRLSAVTTEQGKPVAWFKKAMPASPSSAAPSRQGTQADAPDTPVEEEVGENEPGASAFDDLAAELDIDVAS